MREGPCENEVIAFCAISRGAALTRGLLWAAASAICGAITVVVFRSLDFSPSGAAHRLVDVSILVLTLPVTGIGLYLAVLGLRWIGLAAWPAAIGMIATDDALTLRLGAFGTRRFDVARLELKYAFELSGDEADGGFESFLPEKDQISQFLPRMQHPAASDHLNLAILKFARGSEREVARALRPAFEKWRSTGK